MQQTRGQQGNAQHSRLRGIAPGWGAVVMGTSVISTIFAALGQSAPAWAFANVIARLFLAIAVIVGIVVIGLTSARWIRYPRDAWADLSHPVKGGMAATLGGSFLTLAVAIGRSGQSFIGSSVTDILVVALGTIGGVIALVFGWVFLSGLFAKGETDVRLITGALFIPPVVTVIVPAALASVVRPETPGAGELLALLWALLGIGFILYIVITAALLFRTITTPLPPAALAPTLFIGMGPAGLIALDVLLLTNAASRLGLVAEGAVTVAGFVGAALWGFGFWWMVAALLVLRSGYDRLPFALSSWGFTFPLGAWSAAGVVIGSAIDSSLLLWAGVTAGVVLVVIWVIFAAKTIRGVATGDILAS